MEKYTEEPVSHQAALQVAAVFKSVNLMSVGVAALLSTGMIVDKHSVTVSVLSGVGFYGAIAGLLILWQPGALPSVLISHQREVTLRRRDALPYKHAQQPAERIQVLPYTQMPDSLPVDPVRLPETPRYIPAVPRISDAIKLDASNFVTQLFDPDTGRPLPTKITRNKGQIQHKSPEAATVEYLMSLGIVRTGEGNQLYFDTSLYPTHRDALNALRTGVRPSPWQGDKEEGIL